MNQHVQKILSDARDIRVQSFRWYREQPKWRQILEAAAVALGLVFLFSLGGDETEQAAQKAQRTVSLAAVSDLANSDTSLSLLGTVTSTSEATIRSETSGKLTRVYKKLGDPVSAGQIIAEFENSGERAAVLQAEGAYDAAKAAREIAKINSGSTDTSLLEAKQGALNALASAYITMDDVIRVKTDSAYVDPRLEEVRWNVLVPDSMLTLSLEAKRKVIEGILVERDKKNRTLSLESNLVSELNAIQTEAQTIKTYLDDMATAYSKALPDNNYDASAIATAKTNVNLARTSISAALSAITASRTSLNAAISAQEVAQKTAGGSSSEIASADASVKQALGAYNAALSRLEKTVIRSPISGTINSLSIKTGDFISAFTEVAIVSNNGALEVLSYVTEDDARRISVGSEVAIDGVAKGVITRIASALDPRTKKIEVRVGILDKTTPLVNGQSVRIAVTKDKKTVSATSGPIKIPLSALKLTPQGAFVFVVNASSTLETIPVKEGAILGEEIQILSGLTGAETIVTDARGLKAGTQVTIKETQ